MLDELTIMLMMAVMQVLIALLAVAIRRGHAEFAEGLGAWAAGVVLMSLGMALTLLGQGIVDTPRLMLNNACYVSGVGLVGYGVRRFFGQAPVASRWITATVLVYLAGVAFSLDPRGQLPMRISIFMAQLLVVALLGLQAVWQARPGGLGLKVTAIGLLLLILAALLRGSAAVTGWGGAGMLMGSHVQWLVASVLGLSWLLGTLGMILIVGERIRQRLQALATHDSLTGLLTRSGFAELAAHVLAATQRESRTVGFLLVDVDHFKAINDRYGHQTGDAVLAEVARRLRRAAREIDLVCRFGGEEFAVLLPETDAARARFAGERLREQVAGQPIAVGEQSLSVTVSIGASSGDHASSIDLLYREADAALYRAKAAGRNRVEVADGSITAATMPA